MVIMRKNSFTLLELIIVIVIVGILATLGLLNYGGIKESTLGKEAKVNLKLLAAAEKIYKMESNDNIYAYCTAASSCNTLLKLSIVTSNPNWNYSVTAPGSADSFTAVANRTAAGVDCQYSITDTIDEPVIAGGTDCR